VALQLGRGPERLTGGAEYGEGLIPPQLDDLAASRRHGLPDECGKPRGESGCRLVASLDGEAGVAPHIGDQESANGHPFAGWLTCLFGRSPHRRSCRPTAIKVS
jgi:hypothetical protein